MNHRILLSAAVAAAVLGLAGCKKDASNKDIELPEGQIHLGAQWAGEELWVESFDPKTGTCSFSQYKDNKVVESSTITLKNCRAGMMGGPMMRPMMSPGIQGRPGMMNRQGMPPREGMPPRPGMAPPPAPPGAAPQPEGAAPTQPAPPPKAE